MSAAATGTRPAEPTAAPGAARTSRLPAWAPAATCAALVALGGLLTALVGVHVTAWTLDETGYKVSAVHYTTNMPHNLFNDYTARATSRLYALTVMPLFALAHGDVAIRLAKVYNCVLWCSIAVPLWHMARPLLTPWRRVAAVTLSVVAPWLVYTTALFTEALAMAGFVWFTWAALLAVRRPAWWRDLLTLVAFAVAVTARTQLAGILVGYLGLIAFVLVRAWVGGGGPWWWRTRATAWRLRDFPVTTVAVLLGVVVVARWASAGLLQAKIDELLGGYQESHPVLMADGFAMLLVEVLGIGVGVGIVAVLFAVPWYARTLTARRRDDVWWFALVTLVVGGVLMAFTAYGQGGFWGNVSEERYWMYPFAFLWIAAFRAAQERSVRAQDVLLVGAVFVVTAGLLAPPRTLDFEGVFFAPVLATLGSAAADGLEPITSSPRDTVALAVLLACGVAWLVVRRTPWVRPDWLLGGGAALQLALTAVPLLAMLGHVNHGQAKRTGGDFAALGWVDRHAGGRAVAWLDSEPRRNQDALFGIQLTTLFWNARIESRAGVAGSTPGPDRNPLDALPLAIATVDARSGRLTGIAPGTRVIAWADSPYVQVVGRTLARSPAYPSLRLVKVAAPARALWRARGIDPAGDLVPGRGAAPATFDAWPRTAGARLTFTFVGGRQPAAVQVRAGRASARVEVPAGGTAQATLIACGAHVRGRLRALARDAGVGVGAVAVEPVARCGEGAR